MIASRKSLFCFCSRISAFHVFSLSSFKVFLGHLLASSVSLGSMLTLVLSERPLWLVQAGTVPEQQDTGAEAPYDPNTQEYTGSEAGAQGEENAGTCRIVLRQHFNLFF